MGAGSPVDTEQLQIRQLPLDKAIELTGLNGGVTQEFNVVGMYRAWRYVRRDR
ncbi:MAG TPA: hypothetical protein VKT80_16055 [Chloroflexota bacterium]|nr:hypothetical protein [Chloroflexota bacterium]